MPETGGTPTTGKILRDAGLCGYHLMMKTGHALEKIRMI